MPYKLMMIIYVSTNEANGIALPPPTDALAQLNKFIHGKCVAGHRQQSKTQFAAHNEIEREKKINLREWQQCGEERATHRAADENNDCREKLLSEKWLCRQQLGVRLPPNSIYQLSKIIFSLSFFFHSFSRFSCFDDDTFKFKLAGLDVRACVCCGRWLNVLVNFFSHSRFLFAVANH